MPQLTCRICGRKVDTVPPGEAPLAGERRCPRCGAFLDADGRDVERRVTLRHPATAILADMHIGFLGFGLIAGSVARDVRANPATSAWTMAAWSPSGDGPGVAVTDGVIDRVAARPEDALADADLIVLAAPVTATLTLIDRLAGEWRPAIPAGAVVTDVGSTKSEIVARADAAGLRFVGGHPMAGRETAGYGGSEAGLFVDRPWVVVPGTHTRPPDVERVAELARACGARIVRMDAAGHDRAVAGISHLPLVVAAALVEAVALSPDPGGGSRGDWPVLAELAAGGWRDTTRVAGGDPAMGAAIAVTNAPAIAARIRDLQLVLDGWLAELERPGGPDEHVVAERFAAARAILADQR